MVWSLALCPDDTKQNPVVYGAEFGGVFLAKGPRTASIQEGLDCLRLSRVLVLLAYVRIVIPFILDVRLADAPAGVTLDFSNFLLRCLP